jgi:hypothetical protein
MRKYLSVVPSFSMPGAVLKAWLVPLFDPGKSWPTFSTSNALIRPNPLPITDCLSVNRLTIYHTQIRSYRSQRTKHDHSLGHSITVGKKKLLQFTALAYVLYIPFGFRIEYQDSLCMISFYPLCEVLSSKSTCVLFESLLEF